jgi:hypothetical protein
MIWLILGYFLIGLVLGGAWALWDGDTELGIWLTLAWPIFLFLVLPVVILEAFFNWLIKEFR